MMKLRRVRAVLFVISAMAAFSLTACGRNDSVQEQTTTAAQTAVQETTTKKEVALSDIHEAVKAVYGENYLPSVLLDAQYITDVFGITEDMYETVIAEVSMISAQVDTFAAFKAKEGQADAIEEKLTEYKDYLLNESLQYPMNIPKIEAAQVVREGDCVFYVQLGQAENDMAEEDELLKEFQESNQLAVDAIREQFK